MIKILIERTRAFGWVTSINGVGVELDERHKASDGDLLVYSHSPIPGLPEGVEIPSVVALSKFEYRLREWAVEGLEPEFLDASVFGEELKRIIRVR